MKYKKCVGAHVSASGGVENAPFNAFALEANAFALFIKNQRQWTAPPLTDHSIIEFKKNLSKSKIEPQHVLPHDSYLINLGNNNPEKRNKSITAFIDEINRVQQLGLTLLNFHPGSHLNEISEEESLNLIIDSINEAINKTEDIILVIENTAGQGTNLGYCFDHLSHIIDGVRNKKRVGICIDTCHLYSSGYDFASSKTQFDKVFKEFEKEIGFKYLKGMHLNDSKVECGKRVDRHESIGKGYIGLNSFKWLMKDSRFDNIPLILETPNSDIWKDEIKLLKSF